MKKFLTVCFELLLCLVLTACGNSASDNLASDNMKADIIVHLEVNPSFDIYADKDGIIESVECLNEDAQTVYKEMDLKGAEYTLGFEQLLTAIKDNGFLEENAKLEIRVKTRASVELKVSEALEKVVSDFSANVIKVESNIKSEVVKAESKLNKESTWCIDIDINADSNTDLQIYLDENQTITYIHRNNDTAEKIAEKADAKGKNIKEGFVALMDAGCSLGYFQKSVEVNVTKEPEPLSLYIELNRWTADYMSKSKNDFDFSVSYNPKDWKEFESLNVKIGTMESDGRIWDCVSVLENGIYKSTKRVSADGGMQEYRYSEDGESSYEYCNVPDSFISEVFYENGQMVKAIQQEANGRYTESLYENGQLVKYIFRDSEAESESIYENGKIKKSVVKKKDGSYHEAIYYENGNFHEEYRIDENGTKTDVIYDLDGKVKELKYTYTDGRWELYDEDGNVTYGSNP